MPGQSIHEDRPNQNFIIDIVSWDQLLLENQFSIGVRFKRKEIGKTEKLEHHLDFVTWKEVLKAKCGPTTRLDR